MSARNHRSDYAILIGLGIGVAVVFALLIGWGLVRNDRAEGKGVRTTFSTGGNGTMACYLLYERLGYHVARSERPLAPDVLAGADVLVLLDPITPLSGAEADALQRWVGSGGVLVCDGSLDLWPWMSGRTDGPFRFSVGPVEFSDLTVVPAEYRGCLLARDVGSVTFATPLTTSSSTSGWRKKDESEDDPSREALFRDNVGARIEGRACEKGRVIGLADSSFASNGLLGRHDNAVLAANVVAYAQSKARGRRIVFEEFHHGFGPHKTDWTLMAGMILTTPAGWAVLALTAAGLLLLVLKGRRFGTRCPPPPARRRSKLEYVYSVGATYRAAGAHSLTLRLVFERFRRDAARAAGLPASAPVPAVAAALARRTGAPAKRYEDLLTECEAAAAAPRLSQHAMSRLAGRLARMEVEISHGHPPRQ
jgi:hypothetical protein